MDNLEIIVPYGSRNKPISSGARIEDEFCLLARAVSWRNLEGEGEIFPLDVTAAFGSIHCSTLSKQHFGSGCTSNGPFWSADPVNVRPEFSGELVGAGRKR